MAGGVGAGAGWSSKQGPASLLSWAI